MIAKFIVTLAFADAQTLKQADFRESAQEVGGQNAEAVIDAPEEGDRRQLALKRQDAIRRKTTTLPPKKKPLNRQNAVRRKLDEEDPEAEAEGEADKEDPEAETEGEADEEDEDSEARALGEADEEDSEAEAEGEADKEDPEAETEGEAEGGLENDRRQLESACVDKQTTDDRCLSSHHISGLFSKNFKVGASCSYWKGQRWCLNDNADYQDSKRAMKDCCALTCDYCGANKREAGPKTPTFVDKIAKVTDTLHAVTDNVEAVKGAVKGVGKAVEGVGHAVGLPVDRIKNKSKQALDAGKNKAKELARKGGNKVKEAVNSSVRKAPKGSGGNKKRSGSKKPTKRRSR